ncbi:hypothetical protein [Daejeonella lutea]|uniref:Glycosyltransferase RgtA/B/C/D-like domain-containing protein n=1 Tax=Daejeonella lutea TaxID=572036 RepID=A0A1T5DYP6_9SPHI|nr:hypothetical protein [Daejeonella lutea]SKB76765.1 hypothetical protein SAMN05661099_2742 [Daejeonella lutea]
MIYLKGVLKQPVLHLILIFAISRLMIFVIGALSYSMFPEHGQVAQKRSLTEILDIPAIWDRLDSGWYEKLAEEGYPKRPFTETEQETWGFMPLYPLLIALASKISGLSLFSSGLLISNICTLFGLFWFYRLVQEKYELGIESAGLVMISAGSFFLSIVYSEGLFFMLSALVFYLTFAKRFGWALIIAGLASVTRIQGCLLFIIPGLELMINHRKQIVRYLPAGFISILPMAFLMIYLARTCGEPLAFIKIQTAWGSSDLFPLQGFLSLFSGVRPGGTWTHACFWLMSLIIVIISYRRLPLSYLIFTICYFMLSSSNETLYGSARYLLGVLPVFVAAAIGSPFIRQFFVVVNVLFLSLMISAFVTDTLTFL